MVMRIGFRKGKKGINVYANSKILLSDFRKWFLCNLIGRCSGGD